MGLLDSVLKVFVGDKSKKDVAELQPNVNKTLSFEKAMESLSIDELRHKTAEFKEKIAHAKANTLEQIATLKETANNEEDIDKREEIYEQIDKLHDQAYDEAEVVLNDIMPEAFAVMKETAKRFFHNEEIRVLQLPRS